MTQLTEPLGARLAAIKGAKLVKSFCYTTHGRALHNDP